MNREQPSTAAVITAVGRGDQRLSDPPPWILDDPFALWLVGPEWREVLQSAVPPSAVERDRPAIRAPRNRRADAAA
jgi:hypothetical protein